jgi:hypothetical protein
MSFRSRIEHFEVHKTLQGGQLPPPPIFFVANLGTFFWLIWGHPLFLTVHRITV